VSLPTARDLAEYTLGQQHPITEGWSPPGVRVKLLTGEHQIDLDLAADQDLAAARRDRFAPGQPADLFLNSWEQVRPGLYVMLSIRYESGNPARPFVDFSAASRPRNEDRDIAAVAVSAALRYGILRPACLRWWTSRPAGAIPGTSHDRRFLAAPLGELTGQPVPGQLALQTSRDLSRYGQAVAAYQSVDRTHPDHPRQAAIETADDLAGLQRDGTLFDVLLDGRWAGYVAAEPGHTLGLAGYTVAELILTDAARGHGYGRHLTTLLAQALSRPAPAGTAVLTGTIHQRNTGALRAARQAGRHDIGGWVTIPLQ
jgi:GNAT superfamily N-acetyltransferase